MAAGKYNDGSTEMRSILAQRMVNGFGAAWENTEGQAVTAADVSWEVQPVILPPSPTYGLREMIEQMAKEPDLRLARYLTFAQRMNHGVPILLSALKIGDARVLHMPGELFVEYQLSAQTMRPDLFVAMAAYGDYGAGYIGTEASYPRGGYEVGYVSRVAPSVESVLTGGMRELLNAPPGAGKAPSDFTREKARYEPVVGQ